MSICDNNIDWVLTSLRRQIESPKSQFLNSKSSRVTDKEGISCSSVAKSHRQKDGGEFISVC